MTTTARTWLIFALAAGSVYADTLALVAADSTVNENAAQQALMATGKFSAVDIIDTQTSTPDLAVLGTYTHVLAWASAAPFDRVALGNRLADFYDLPGKHLTVATFAFSKIDPVPPFNLPDPEIQGRVASAPYAALTNVGVNGDVSGSLVAAAPGDPIFAGIDLSTVFYAENQYFAHPGLAAGATLLAADGSGTTAIAKIARSQNGVIDVNFYPGGTRGETAGNNNAALFNLLTKTFPAAQTTTDTTPPVTAAGVQPAPNAGGWNNSNVTLTLTATDNAGGSGVKQINLMLSGAQTGSSVISGNSGSVSITSEATTTITYSSSDNAGNTETAKTLTVMLDKTPPTVTATANPAPDTNGKNTTPVTVTFSGTDSLSGIKSCTAPIVLKASGTATGTCTDNAGNTSTSVSKTVTIVSGGTAGPVIHGVPAPGKCVLHPANNELVPAATLSVDPHQTTSFDVTGVSNQPAANGRKDIVIRGTGLWPRLIELRAVPPASGTDRIYTLTATATGKSGQTTVDTFTCTVSAVSQHHHDNENDHDRDDQHN